MSFKKIALSICLLLICSNVFSQNKLDSLQSLSEIVIQAEPFKAVIPAQKLSGVQLETLSSHNVADALRYFAGVKVKDYGGMGGLKTIDVRNMGSTHVGVFYNGVQVGNAQNGTVDLGKFSLDDIDEISLYNGQRSEIFQSAKDFASSAAVYIKAKRPQFVEGKNTNVTVRYKMGSIETYNPSFRLEQKLSDVVSFTASAEYLKSPGRYKFRYKKVDKEGKIANDTTAYRQNSDIQSYRIEGSVFAYFKDGGIMETNLYYYDSKRGLPAAVVRGHFKGSERLSDKSFFVQSSYIKEFSDKYQFQAKAKYSYDYTHYNSLDTTVLKDNTSAWVSMQHNNTYYQQDLYLSLINKYSILPNWDVALSVDFDYNKLNASFRNKLNKNAPVAGVPFSYPQRYSLLYSLSTALDLGKFKAQASLVGSFVHEKVRVNTKAPDKNEFSPAIFLGYKPFEKHDFNLRLFYKRIFRMPTFNDLYYAQIGYSALKPEYTNQINFGATYVKGFNNPMIPTITVQADAYYMSVTDKIIAAPNGSLFRWMMTNMGKVKGHGVDASVNLASQINKVNLSGTFTYSYSSAKDYTDKQLTSYKSMIPYTPWHTASAIFTAGYRGWNVNYSFIYVGKRYNQNVNNIPVNLVQPWYTHDLSLQKEITIHGIKLKGTVEANNLLNQYYDVVKNYPMPGRNYKFIISVNI